MDTNTLFKVKRLGLGALAALALLVMGCENPSVWNEDSEARGVKAGTATISTVSIDGIQGIPLKVPVIITLASDTFVVNPGTDATSWFSNLPTGLSAIVNSISGDDDEIATLTVSGTPQVVSSFWIKGTVPGAALDSKTPAPIDPSQDAAYNILWPRSGWTQSASSPLPTSAVNSAAYGKGVFVVGSRVDGSASYSPDGGITWRPINPGFGTNWISNIAFINGAFYAGGKGGILSTSTDGTKWTVIGTGLLSGEDIRAIAYGNGVMVIGGTNGEAEWTTDPTNPQSWTPITGFPSSFTGNFNSIAFGTDTSGSPLFVITGQQALSGYSTDGKTWTDTTDQTVKIFINSGGQSSIKMVAYDPDHHKFVIVGFHEAAYAVPQGGKVSWTGVDLTDIMGSTSRTSWLNAVAFGGGYFVAGGSLGVSISSTDGINWAVTGAKGQFPATDVPFVNAIAYNGDGSIPVYLIGGGLDAGPGIAAYNTN
ncbi:MAG: hypothetical protein LBG24_11295 [Treponema sp.]|jgi:hypothetical protein|nr:hypothetical protein [Treponema sp.]